MPVVRKVSALAGLDVRNPVVLHGSSRIDAQLPNLLKSASRRTPVVVLRDVDPTPPNLKGRRFVQCGSTVLRRLKIPNRARGFRFRLARHEIESWLLADSGAFADWLGVPEASIPRNPDDLPKPSLTIVELARHPRANEHLRKLIVPTGTAKFGKGFEGAVMEFANGQWSARRARLKSRSLDRCLNSLEKLAKEVR